MAALVVVGNVISFVWLGFVVEEVNRAQPILYWIAIDVIVVAFLMIVCLKALRRFRSKGVG